MKQHHSYRALLISAIILIGSGHNDLAYGQETAGMTLESQRDMVNNYCESCHSDVDGEGGFSFSELDLAHPEQNAAQAERVILKLRSGMMPPVGMPRPDPSTLKALASALETRIDEAADATEPHVSAPELHRINSNEYRNSVLELLNLEVDVADLLPPDPTTNGFDNMSEALTISPALMSAYIRAAEKISRDAVGDPEATARMSLYKISRLANQMRHVPGTPFGTRGGTSVMHTFLADGEYEFKVVFYYDYPGELMGWQLPEQMQGQQVEISVDRERVAVIDVDPTITEEKANYVTARVKISGGQRRLAAAFISKFDGPVQDHYRLVEQTLADITITTAPELTGLPHLQSFSVTGPFNPTGISQTASRRKIFTCRSDREAEEEACAKEIISELAGKAFRRPVTPEDLESLLKYYEYGAREGGFESGVRWRFRQSWQNPNSSSVSSRNPRRLLRGASTGSPTWNWHRDWPISSGARFLTTSWSGWPPRANCGIPAPSKARSNACWPIRGPSRFRRTLRASGCVWPGSSKYFRKRSCSPTSL